MSGEFALNQFGQVLERGTIVGYTNRTGSTTSRKVGVVTGFGIRREYDYADRVVAKVRWIKNGAHFPSPGVDPDHLFALDARNLDRDIINGIIDAL